MNQVTIIHGADVPVTTFPFCHADGIFRADKGTGGTPLAIGINQNTTLFILTDGVKLAGGETDSTTGALIMVDLSDIHTIIGGG